MVFPPTLIISLLGEKEINDDQPYLRITPKEQPRSRGSCFLKSNLEIRSALILGLRVLLPAPVWGTLTNLASDRRQSGFGESCTLYDSPVPIPPVSLSLPTRAWLLLLCSIISNFILDGNS